VFDIKMKRKREDDDADEDSQPLKRLCSEFDVRRLIVRTDFQRQRMRFELFRDSRRELEERLEKVQEGYSDSEAESGMDEDDRIEELEGEIEREKQLESRAADLTRNLARVYNLLLNMRKRSRCVDHLHDAFSFMLCELGGVWPLLALVTEYAMDNHWQKTLQCNTPKARAVYLPDGAQLVISREPRAPAEWLAWFSERWLCEAEDSVYQPALRTSLLNQPASTVPDAECRRYFLPRNERVRQREAAEKRRQARTSASVKSVGA